MPCSESPAPRRRSRPWPPPPSTTSPPRAAGSRPATWWPPCWHPGSEHVVENLIGVLAKNGRAARAQSGDVGEVQRTPRRQVGADAGVLDLGEHRVVQRAARVVGDQL